MQLSENMKKHVDGFEGSDEDRLKFAHLLAKHARIETRDELDLGFPERLSNALLPRMRIW